MHRPADARGDDHAKVECGNPEFSAARSLRATIRMSGNCCSDCPRPPPRCMRHPWSRRSRRSYYTLGRGLGTGLQAAGTNLLPSARMPAPS